MALRLLLLWRLGGFLLSLFGLTLAPGIVVWSLARPEAGLFWTLVLAGAASCVGLAILLGLDFAGEGMDRAERRLIVRGFGLIGAVVAGWLLLT